MKRPKRDKLAQFKIAPAAYENLRELAASRDQTVSAFCRGAVMAEVGAYLSKLQEFANDEAEN